MDDSELLKKYEPVLRFAKSERFFPMAVEPYLEKCMIFPSGPQGVVGLLSNSTEPLVTRIGKLPSGEYFLRFVNDPLVDSDVWVGWGIFSALVIVTGWYASGWRGAGVAAVLALVAALIIFIQASLSACAFFRPHWSRFFLHP